MSRDQSTRPRGSDVNSSVSPKSVRFDEDTLWVDLSDGRTLGVPLAWFPRLLKGTPEQRERVRISSRGLHWDVLDEDISVAGLLAVLATRAKAAVKLSRPDSH